MAEKVPFHPMVKTTAHAQWNLKHTEHEQVDFSEKMAQWTFQSTKSSRMAQMAAMDQKDDFSVYIQSLRICSYHGTRNSKRLFIC